MHYIQQVVGNSERPSMQTMWSIDGRSMEQNHAKREAFPPVNSSISQRYERIENLIRSQITRNSISEANDYKLLQSEQLHCYFFGKENTDPWRFNVKTSVEAPKLAPKPTFEAIQVTHRLISSYAPVGSGGSRWSCEITVPQYIQWWSITIFYSYTSGIFSSEHVTNIWIKHLMKTRWKHTTQRWNSKEQVSLDPISAATPSTSCHPSRASTCCPVRWSPRFTLRRWDRERRSKSSRMDGQKDLQRAVELRRCTTRGCSILPFGSPPLSVTYVQSMYNLFHVVTLIASYQWPKWIETNGYKWWVGDWSKYQWHAESNFATKLYMYIYI